MRKLAPKLGAVDLPSGRRVNQKIIPRLGGVAIAAGFLLPILALLFYDNDVGELFREHLWRALGICVGGVVICGLGAWDDLKGVRALYKLYVQLAAASAAYFCGFQIDAIHLPYVGILDMGALAFPLTVFWIVGIINALNLIDGLDGLAGGVALSACVVNIVIGLVSGNLLVTLLSVALAGAVLGFLFFNFNPATIFMGDSGSMFLGYVLATTSLLGAKGTTAVGLLVPVLAMGLPILDTLSAIARRVLSRRPVFSSDRHHFHHRLLEMGLTHKRAVLTLYGISVLFMASALVVYLGKDWVVGGALVSVSIAIAVLIRTVAIFRTPRVTKSDVDELSLWRSHLLTSLHELEMVPVQNEIWSVLSRFAQKAALFSGQCEVNGEGQWNWETNESEACEGMRGYVCFTVPFEVASSTEPARMAFGWYCDAGKVLPEHESLLRLLTDAVEKACKRCSISNVRVVAGGENWTPSNIK